MRFFICNIRFSLLLLAFLAGVLYWLQYFFLFYLVVLLFTVLCFFLRQPRRYPPPRALDVLSPIDGLILGYDVSRDPYLSRSALCVRMQQTWLGANTIFSPTEGKFERYWNTENQIKPGCIALWIRTDECDDVVLEIANYKLSAPESWFQWICLNNCVPGERVGQGQRLGIIGPAFKCSLYLPESSRLLVEAQQKIIAAEQTLAQYHHGTGELSCTKKTS